MLLFFPFIPSFILFYCSQIAQTTSSILGNPPSNLKYSLPVPTSSSILGTAPPQLQTSIGGPIPQQTMTPPVVTGHPPPPPVPPPPPPPILPPMINSQPSLLGNPPFPLLVPQTGQGVPQPPQPPPSTNHPPMFYGNQYDNNVPVTLPPPSLIQNLPNQFPSHPSMAITPRDIVAEQFPGPGLRNESSPVFGFSPGNYPIEGLSPQIGAENGPNSLGRWDPKFGGQRILNESTGLEIMVLCVHYNYGCLYRETIKFELRSSLCTCFYRVSLLLLCPQCMHHSVHFLVQCLNDLQMLSYCSLHCVFNVIYSY